MTTGMQKMVHISAMNECNQLTHPKLKKGEYKTKKKFQKQILTLINSQRVYTIRGLITENTIRDEMSKNIDAHRRSEGVRGYDKGPLPQANFQKLVNKNIIRHPLRFCSKTMDPPPPGILAKL